jgi:hypothetical protein
MIKPEDAEFHFNKDSHWQWVETIALPFHIPGTTIGGIVYVMARPMLGVCMADITLHDRITDLWEEQLYIDNQQHLPCPKSLLSFTLPNGLSVEATDPTRAYRVRYEGIDDTRIALDFVALHEPYDLNDPDMDPTAAVRANPAWDTSWSGHYDVTYHITGEVIVRGKRHVVDCVDTGDRSWGPRAERDNSSVIWWHASFGKARTVHLFVGHDIASTPVFGDHISGYVMEDGQTYGIVSSRGQQEYRGALPLGGELKVTDVRGKSLHMTYSALNACYWAPYPSNSYVQSLMRVNCAGTLGYGVQQLGLSRAYLTRHRDAIRLRY